MIFSLVIVIAIFWLCVLIFLDKNKKSSGILVGALFVGVLSVIPAAFLEETLLGFQEKDFFDFFITHMLIVGPVEEFSKFIVFLFFTKIFKTIKRPIDGVLQAAAVALAFASIENNQYAHFFGMDVLIYRSLICIPGHMSLAAIWGLYFSIGYFDQTRKESKSKYTPAFIALIPAAFFHGLSNLFMTMNIPSARYLVDVCVLILSIMIYIYLKKRSPYQEIKTRRNRFYN